jgi:hypothetical protein
VHVERTHHVDRIPPDLALPVLQRYEYDIFRFYEGDEVLVARSYSMDPSDAHFLRREFGPDHFGLTPRDTTTPLFLSAVSYLREIGMLQIRWLNFEGEGYEALSAPT